MKKILFCVIFLTFSSLFLQAAQSPQGKDGQKTTKNKHVVDNDKELLWILNQTRKQQLADPKHTKRIFDTDPIPHSENKKG